MNEQSKLELGADATNYLYALRSLEEAREYYFRGLVGEFGEEGASNKMAREALIWEATMNLVEKTMSVLFRDWAGELKMRAII